MCYIFSCFGWALDFIQRALTFILACILCCFVCTGILVAIAAGVAYGYNYSMAEFLTFTRQDTTVYMRRGQFYDKPDFDTDKDIIYSRKSGGGGVDMSQNGAGDSENLDASLMRSGGKSLQDSWSQVKDTRKYAEILTKFTRTPAPEEADQDPLTRATPAPVFIPPPVILPVKRVSIPPNPRVVPTSLMPNGASHIVMRNFKPFSSHESSTNSFPEIEMANSDEESDMDLDHEQPASFYTDEQQQRRTKFFQLDQRPTLPDLPPDGRMEKQPAQVPMRHWAASKAPLRTEPVIDYKEDIDEDNVVYKPI